MKTLQHLLPLALMLAAAQLAPADVPSAINYQGRLTNSAGLPQPGTRAMSLKIYDAATSGTLLYSETVGNVVVDANGVYGFQFGATGTSNTLVSETVATTNGTSSTFQSVLVNSPVLAGSVSVTDGTYTWSQSAGSSDDNNFGVFYSSSLRRVTVTYLSAAPAAGQTITVTYRYATSGISGAFAAGAGQWLELTVDGVAQSPRQKVLAVPFAVNAQTADYAREATDSEARRQLSYMLTSINSGNSAVLNKTLVSQSNYYGNRIQATYYGSTTFTGSTSGTTRVSPAPGSSKTAANFLIEPGYGTSSGWFEINYSDGQIVTQPNITARTLFPNPYPAKEVAFVRASVSCDPYQASVGVGIFTAGKAQAVYNITGSPTVQRGAFTVYSSNGADISNVEITVGLMNGTIINTTSGYFVELGSPVTTMTISATSSSVTASFDTVKINY